MRKRPGKLLRSEVSSSFIDITTGRNSERYASIRQAIRKEKQRAAMLREGGRILNAYLGGQMTRRHKRLLRNTMIVAKVRAGMRPRAAAWMFGVSRPMVSQLLAKEARDRNATHATP